MVKHIVFSIPPFHMQKHALESIERQVVFHCLIKTPFCNAILFKSSVFANLSGRVDRACRKLDVPTGPVWLPHRQAQDATSPAIIVDTANVNDSDDEDEQFYITDSANDDEDEEFDAETEAKRLLKLVKLTGRDDASAMESQSECVIDLVMNITKIVVTRQRSMEVSALETIEKVKPKDSRDGVPPLTSKETTFEACMGEILQSIVTNYQRLKFNSELLFAVFEHADNELRKTNAVVWETNALTRLTHDNFDKQLRLGVEPFNKLNGDGFIQPLYEWLPTFLKLFLVGNKNKICKAGLYLLTQSIWAVENRPDVMAQLATMGPLLNEVLIEYHNATVSRRLALLRVEFQDIRDASVNVGRM
jgi:hypothetical protein